MEQPYIVEPSPGKEPVVAAQSSGRSATDQACDVILIDEPLKKFEVIESYVEVAKKFIAQGSVECSERALDVIVSEINEIRRAAKDAEKDEHSPKKRRIGRLEINADDVNAFKLTGCGEERFNGKYYRRQNSPFNDFAPQPNPNNVMLRLSFYAWQLYDECWNNKKKLWCTASQPNVIPNPEDWTVQDGLIFDLGALSLEVMNFSLKWRFEVDISRVKSFEIKECTIPGVMGVFDFVSHASNGKASRFVHRNGGVQLHLFHSNKIYHIIFANGEKIYSLDRSPKFEVKELFNE